MASIIRIKRSSTAGNPSTLAAGELAYSALTDNGSNGGDRLYIGIGSETSGNAANHYVVGGKYYTDLMAGTAGTLNTTAKSVPILSSSGTIDKWYVGNVYITGNTITTTDTNGNLILNANGTGKVSVSNTWTLPNTAGTNNYILTTDGNGTASWSAPASSSFTLAANTGTNDTFNTGETLTFTGTSPIATAVSNNTITISATDATTSAKGVASFSSSNFSVTSGAVSLATGGVSNSNLANSSITINGSSVSLGGSVTISAAITNSVTFNSGGAGDASPVTFDGTAAKTISYNTIGASPLAGSSSITTVGTVTSGTWSAGTIAVAKGGTGTTDGSITGTGALTFASGGTNSNLNLRPTGTVGNALAGTVDVGGYRISSVATPTSDTDAANKAYVDAAVTSLHVHDSCQVATTNNLASLTGGTITYSNGTNNDGIGATLILSGSPTRSFTSADVFDAGYTPVAGTTRVLVKNQTSAIQNGIYVVTNSTTLTRATDFDSTAEAAGGDFVFVTSGATNGDTGWVQTHDNPVLGTDPITWTQFSGAGAITAGDGMTQSGTTLNVVGTSNRITVSADAVDIASTYVGQSSITTVGTITSGTWNGTAIANANLANSSITVNGNSVSLGGSTTVTANTTNSLTFNNSGSGDASGGTFNGSAAKTISYNSVGASPLAGSSSITTVGTIASGTWNGNAVGSGYGGTGFSTYTTGDIIYASATNTLSKLAVGSSTAGQVLQLSGGVPVWGDLDGGTY